MRDKLEYWHKLNNKYLKVLDDIQNYKKFKVRTNKELKLFGSSSWNIQEFSALEQNEEISSGKFRELVRWEMQENFNKIIKDKINAVRSELSEVSYCKLTKTINVEKMEELKAQIKILKTMIYEAY